VQCHRYHNGDAPLAGKGAAERDPVNRLGIEEFKFREQQRRAAPP
jgi:hypothetical protein